MVKGQPIKVMDWSRCLKKEPAAETQPAQLAEFAEEPKQQPKLNLQPRTRKLPKSQDITVESYTEVEAALIQEAKLNKNEMPSPPPQQTSPFVSPASSTVNPPPRAKKNLNFSLGGFGLAEASQPILFGTGSGPVTPRPSSSPSWCIESEESPVNTPTSPSASYYVLIGGRTDL